MMFTRKTPLAMAVGVALCTPAVYAEEASSIAAALSAGTVKLHLRPRIEHVDQDSDNFDSATARTLKTRLTYQSGSYNGFSLTLEMDDVTEVIETDYSNTVENFGTSVIADPEGTEVNQAYLAYSVGSTTMKYGIQRILLDNQRFVGGVGWRQDEQTYSGFTINSKPAEGLNLFGAYITDVNRIFAETQDHNQETFLANASYVTPVGKIIGYAYLIDNKTAAALSSDTLGLRWQGKAGSVVSYNLEFATQSEAGDNPVGYTADYMLAEVNFAIPAGETKINVKPGYEVMGADEDAGTAFKTPLATLHAFDGWTDLFLVTPSTGIVDTYLNVGTVVGGFKLGAIYHSFASDVDDIDYGTELDLVVGKKVGPVALTFKYADFSADSTPYVDTTKIWLQAAMTF